LWGRVDPLGGAFTGSRSASYGGDEHNLDPVLADRGAKCSTYPIRSKDRVETTKP